MHALDLNTGVPRWYVPLAVAIFGVWLVFVVVNPPRWPFLLATLALSAFVLFKVWVQAAASRGPSILRIGPDFYLSLFTPQGETPVWIAGNPWVSAWLIVLPLRFPSGSMERIVISRDQNHSDAFRRCTVICRFGFAVEDGEGQNTSQTNTSS